jgi:hypothetical protein
MSLNCGNRASNGDACGECPACKAILGRTFMEVIRVAPTGSEDEQDTFFHEWSEAGRQIREDDGPNPEAKRGRRDSFSTNRVGAVLAWASRLAAGGRTKVCIMNDVHLMSHEASNHFLKMLEEPPAGTVWVLLTSEPENLPATIRSRCLPVRFTLLPGGALTGILRGRGDAEPGTDAKLMLGTVETDASALRAGAAAGAEFITLAERFDLAGACEMASRYGRKGEDPSSLLDGIERMAAEALRAGKGDPDRWIEALDAVGNARWRLKNYIERATLDALGADLCSALASKGRTQ